MKKILSILILLFFCIVVHAQQEIMFSQYFVNDMIYNPAISGSKEYNQFTIQTRQQWLGFEGAPLSANMSYHGAINNRSAMGGYLEHDRTSPSNQSSLNISYAYHIPLNAKDTYLSFGLGGKFMYYYLDFVEGDLPPGNDPAYSPRSYESFSGDASSGIYLYSDRFYFGYSAINMLKSSFNNEAGYGFSKNLEEIIHYGLIGYKINIDRDWTVEPSILIRHLEYLGRSYNLSTRVFYSDQIWVGASARSNSSLSFSLGTNSDRVQFAYSYDYYFGEIQYYQNGTHEITISFRTPNSRKY